ncbi:formylglycine-generating enzyme family protein [Leptothoe sp. PORK10 BA2]|uniref:formylglycine-generating enzyme family protein n=1 Tax=Leptothoe sp. PORK10 BA2 TaxID=3110254 RepID=UPI002B20CB63|nr:formylglycine-generating enzyme family protein [Leptothoe sp. PORK10 BA2]MEA5463623.1 formylglycine-generating enzyme family protein [Leptothoe sp. PORK10 BA2]
MRPGKPKVEDIDGLATLLKEAGVDFGAEDVADALWLAGHMGDLSGIAPKQQSDSGNRGTQLDIREEFVDDDTDDESGRAQISLPTRQGQGRGGSQSKSGIAIKAPAAPALRIRLDLARALRPLRRQVPSPGQLEFDEAATLDQIADQQVWFPLLKPVQERWLEVALVVEATASLSLWHETIGEFQTLLERQGAFRRVTTWRLETDAGGKPQLFPHWQRPPQRQNPRRPNHLWDAAGRRLILLVSDCTSEAWYNGSMVRWLEKNGHQAPTAVVQLLPERLWSQSALAQGTSMRLSALEPGTVSAKLTSRPRVPLLQQLLALTEAQPMRGVTVPIVTLEVEPLKQWARVVAGAGDSQTLGVQFDPAAFTTAEASPPAPATPSAAERVQRFRTTASLMAQRLAELMAAAPVSPPIVDLIRQTLLRGAEPVHVAEVYMGGLMEARELEAAEGDSTALEYDFAPGVRTILTDALSRTKTESVLDAVSRYISERLGLNTRSFEALLRFDFQGDPSAQDLVLPFAEIAIPTLQRMGGEYAEFAEQLGSTPKVTPPPPPPDPDDRYPLLQTYTFREATLVFESQPDALPECDVTIEQQFIEALGEGVRPELVEFETASIGSRLPVVGFIDDVETVLTELDHLRGSQIPPQRLKSVQRTILRGTWEGQSYDEIAGRNNYSGATIRTMGYQLWQMLSEALGEKINKSNARDVLTRWTKQTGETELTIRRSTRQAWQYVENLGSGVELAMVCIQAGSFTMGAPEGEEDRSDDEGPQHPVTIAEPFFMGKYPITQAQWRVVAAMPQVERELDQDPANFKRDNRPVAVVSWLDAVEFCARLSQHTGRDYRLPTEAEWEYACRAGTTTPFHFGATIASNLANYRGTSTYGVGPAGEYRQQTTDVGSFPANAFGLYDMHGNVLEWCQDWWHESYEGAPADGSAWLDHEDDAEEKRVLRGGSWSDDPAFCRSADRNWGAPDDIIFDFVGFRVVCGGART